MERIARMQELVEQIGKVYSKLSMMQGELEKLKDELGNVSYELTMLDSKEGEGG